jgi:hypothetical protein
MTEKMIAKCGLICTECEAYIATQAEDIEALTRMANQANEQFGMTMTWEDSRCFGCQSDEKKIGYCDTCTVRLCALEKEVETCAHCPEYGCATITAFIEAAPKAAETLADIRSKL